MPESASGTPGIYEMGCTLVTAGLGGVGPSRNLKGPRWLVNKGKPHARPVQRVLLHNAGQSPQLNLRLIIIFVIPFADLLRHCSLFCVFPLTARCDPRFPTQN